MIKEIFVVRGDYQLIYMRFLQRIIALIHFCKTALLRSNCYNCTFFLYKEVQLLCLTAL